jgi:hypothetical protein
MGLSWFKAHPELRHLPVLESEDDLRIILAGKDFKNGKPGDGESCAIALACGRQLDCPALCIMRDHAYIVEPAPRPRGKAKQIGEAIPGYSGYWVVRRYRLDKEARRAVEDVDLGRAVPIGVSIKLLHTEGTSDTRENRRVTQRRVTQRRKEGIPANPRHQKTVGKVDPLTLAGVRNYRGRAQLAKV